MTVGSLCSGIFRRRRLWNTAEIRSRSESTLVSFSITEASVSTSWTVMFTSFALSRSSGVKDSQRLVTMVVMMSFALAFLANR